MLKVLPSGFFDRPYVPSLTTDQNFKMTDDEEDSCGGICGRWEYGLVTCPTRKRKLLSRIYIRFPESESHKEEVNERYKAS